jgi:hypothetical protein
MTRNRGWTEEELALLYWVLPTMRMIGRLTGRNFPALAMKLANLLAVETDNREGLANASALDRATVARYFKDRKGLERKVVLLLKSKQVTADRATEIRSDAVDVLKTNGVPLHSELIALILAARNPLLIASPQIVREALKSSEYVSEVDSGVFAYTERRGGG